LTKTDLRRALVAVTLFGVSFGFVEAAVVVYLRDLYEPIHARLYPDRAQDALFPLIQIHELEEAGKTARHRLDVELTRELATLLMLAATGLAIGRNPRQTFAAFLVAFGIWDISFYGFLKVLIDWPASLFTWDLLFLLPLPWTGPVLAPMLVAVSMIITGVIVLARETAHRPVRLSPREWAAVFAGGFVVVLAFCWDSRNVMSGGWPNPFPWALLGLGEAIGLAGFGRGLKRAIG
jgi:hypothetical protein